MTYNIRMYVFTISTNKLCLSIKRIKKHHHALQQLPLIYGRMEMDSLAETIVLGSNAIVL